MYKDFFALYNFFREYPEYRFHALQYPRKEFLDLGLKYAHLDYHRGTDYVDEMLFSLANLYVASEAQGFVGTLSSNWCMMVSNNDECTALSFQSHLFFCSLVAFNLILSDLLRAPCVMAIYIRLCSWSGPVAMAATNISRWMPAPHSPPVSKVQKC